MKEELFELFLYNHHSNQQLIALIEYNRQKISDRINLLIHHVINTQQIWNARIKKEKEFDVWQINDWDNILTLENLNHINSLSIIKDYHLDNTIEYFNSKGISYTNKIKDILFHIINHSTYHRAQIATELRNKGIEPINTDYIFYKRNQE